LRRVKPNSSIPFQIAKMQDNERLRERFATYPLPFLAPDNPAK
jgi:hypothetical protein